MIVDLTGVFNIKHKELFKSQAEEVVFYGSAGAGKSYTVAEKCILNAYYGDRVLVVRKSLPSIKRTCIPIVEKCLNLMHIDNYIFNKTDFVMKIGHGEIQFISCNTPSESDKIKSITDIDMIWIEEANEIDSRLYEEIIRLRLRGGNSGRKQIILTLNPIKSSWVYENLTGPNRLRSAHCIQTTIEDNVFLQKEEKNRYIKTLDDLKKYNTEMYRIYRLGEWGDINISDVFKIEDFQFYNPHEAFIPRTEKIAYADLGFSRSGDWTIIVTGRQDYDGYIYIEDVGRYRGNTNDMIDYITDYCGRHGIERVGIEANFRQHEDVYNIETELRHRGWVGVVDYVQNITDKDRRIRLYSVLVAKYCKFREDWRDLGDYRDFLNELFVYGNWATKAEAHDDDADAITAFVSKMFSGHGVLKQEEKRKDTDLEERKIIDIIENSLINRVY